MKKDKQKNPWEVENTFKDYLIVILQIGLPVWILFAFLGLVFISECVDHHNSKALPNPGYREYRTNVHSERRIDEHPISRPKVAPVKSKENALIERMSSEDFYEESDYYDGLDGEYNDIDYNEVVDYLAD